MRRGVIALLVSVVVLGVSLPAYAEPSPEVVQLVVSADQEVTPQGGCYMCSAWVTVPSQWRFEDCATGCGVLCGYLSGSSYLACFSACYSGCLLGTWVPGGTYCVQWKWHKYCPTGGTVDCLGTLLA